MVSDHCLLGYLLNLSNKIRKLDKMGGFLSTLKDFEIMFFECKGQDFAIYEGGSICNANPFITPSTNALGFNAICQTKDLSVAVIMVHETLLYPPQTLFVGGILFSRCPSVRASVRPSVRPSVTLCFLNILKSHCWIFIKPCKHVHICKTNFLDKKVRARGQFYQSYFPL